MKTAISALAVSLLLACSTGLAEPLPALRDGDVIFQISRSSQSLAVQRASGSRYSHMGLIVHRDGEPYVLEAAATVRCTKLDAWIARGERRHFVVKRLRNAAARLTPAVLARAQAELATLAGKPYDLTFEWSDRRMYCSELVWKVYERALGVHLGELQRLGDFDLRDPAVKKKLRERYGERVPLDEPVIAPGAMFVSPELELVIER